MNKRGQGQMHLSFGMIFSIILIIVFIVFAFYAIKKLLDLQENVSVKQFIKSLETDVDKTWKGSGGSQEVTYDLPSGINYVCFVDYSSGKRGNMQNLYAPLKLAYTGDENLFFYPLDAAEGSNSRATAHVNTEGITLTNNPFCIKNNKGKVKMTFSKNYGEALVMIGE
jgi:hypothetical protein